MPAHHTLKEHLYQYIRVAGIGKDRYSTPNVRL